jgi:hypothetical protein
MINHEPAVFFERLYFWAGAIVDFWGKHVWPGIGNEFNCPKINTF